MRKKLRICSRIGKNAEKVATVDKLEICNLIVPENVNNISGPLVAALLENCHPLIGCEGNHAICIPLLAI